MALANTTNDDLNKYLAILDELTTSIELIRAGFGELQEINEINTVYHVPHQLLASGFERLMKCYILLVHAGKHGSYTNTEFVTRDRHCLDRLLCRICKKYFGGKGRETIHVDYTFLTTDLTLCSVINILTLFGKNGRYYNLDVVTGAKAKPVDPDLAWRELEWEVLDPKPFLGPKTLRPEYFQSLHSRMIAIMERFVRAIAKQWTLGEHDDEKGEIALTSSIFSCFRNLRDNELGETDYRRAARTIRTCHDNWIKRSETEAIDSEFPTVSIEKDEFRGEWPFRSEQVVVELRHDMFCVVNIDGYDFALNGAARSRFNLPDPHDAGVAVIGISVGPFIDMARDLRHVEE